MKSAKYNGKESGEDIWDDAEVPPNANLEDDKIFCEKECRICQEKHWRKKRVSCRREEKMTRKKVAKTNGGMLRLYQMPIYKAGKRRQKMNVGSAKKTHYRKKWLP